jgi:hypothetical protein
VKGLGIRGQQVVIRHVCACEMALVCL